MAVFSATWRWMILPSARLTIIVSGVTAPDTIASPSPQAALITTWLRCPWIGLAVNMTPAASAITNSCTTTARATVSGAIACRAR